MVGISETIVVTATTRCAPEMCSIFPAALAQDRGRLRVQETGGTTGPPARIAALDFFRTDQSLHRQVDGRGDRLPVRRELAVYRTHGPTRIAARSREMAQLGALRGAGEAHAFNSIIDNGLMTGGGREGTPGRTERIAKFRGISMMRPTVMEAPAFEYPLFGVELPFPFVVFVRTRSRQETLAAARNSRLVAVAGEDEALTRELMFEPTVNKVYSHGVPGTEFDPREPHEGFLIDFLFERKAFRSGSRGGLSGFIPWLKRKR